LIEVSVAKVLILRRYPLLIVVDDVPPQTSGAMNKDEKIKEQL